MKNENKILSDENTKLMEEIKFLKDLIESKRAMKFQEKDMAQYNIELALDSVEQIESEKKTSKKVSYEQDLQKKNNDESETSDLKNELINMNLERERLLENYRNDVSKLHSRIRELEFEHETRRRISKMSLGSENITDNQLDLEREVEVLRREKRELEDLIKGRAKIVSSIRRSPVKHDMLDSEG